MAKIQNSFQTFSIHSPKNAVKFVLVVDVHYFNVF